MPSLPLKVQVAIRDHWTKPDSPLQKAIKDLQDLLGHSVSIDPEWQLLVTELDSIYPDKGNLVVVVAGVVQAWAKSMAELLDDTAHEDWTETVVDKTANAGGRLRLFLEVAGSSPADSATTWSNSRQGFIITLAKARITHPAELFPVFRAGLLNAFVEPKKKEAIAHRGVDDWADVEMDKTTGRVDIVEKPSHQTSAAAAGKTQKVEFLPTLESLPRPDELLLRPPYFMIVTSGHNNIEVQGSHSPSLKFLADYLKRWCRVNHNDTRAPPAVNVLLYQSAFGLGEMFDRVVISTEDNRYTTQFHVTAPIVLSLIEGVLGYERVSDRPGTWSFRREEGFKIL